MVEVNLDQLAQQLKCSLPTARRLTVDYPDLPVIERGGVGKPWRFDMAEVVAFLQAKRDEEAAEAAERNEALAQLTLPLRGQDDKGATISLDDQLKAAKLRQVQRDEMKEARFLVPTLEVRVALERAYRKLGNALDSALDRAMKSHNLPEPLKRSLERDFAEARTAFVKDATEFLQMKEGGDEPLTLFG